MKPGRSSPDKVSAKRSLRDNSLHDFFARVDSETSVSKKKVKLSRARCANVKAEALAERFHTLFLENVPVLAYENRNAAKRFIALVDTLYDKQRILIVSAEERPSKLYPVDHGTEAFEFQRTISRLREMQSDDWLNKLS